MNVKSTTNRVAGADAARIGKRTGWAVVVLEGERAVEVQFVSDLRPFVESTRLVAVDIPIGLPGDDGIPSDPQGRRLADIEAYAFVGARRNSVFWAPPRAALIQPTYTDARRQFPSLSSQAYHLGTRILEVDALVFRGAPFIEYHPEVSFRALGGRPLDYAKKSWNGQQERRRILELARLQFPATLQGDAGQLAVDDILDAAAGALTAQAVVQDRGLAVGGGEDVDWQDRGVIWCPRPP